WIYSLKQGKKPVRSVHIPQTTRIRRSGKGFVARSGGDGGGLALPSLVFAFFSFPVGIIGMARGSKLTLAPSRTGSAGKLPTRFSEKG
ncbi:MAG: hypothetical protein PHO07_17750, partial [Pirellulales bacterium]|nr:hypothetical protein [Pirellulales bacterium]